MTGDQKAAAAYHGSGDCPRSCCWTPYGCGRNWTCDHHRDAATLSWKKALEADLDREMDLASRTPTATRSGIRQPRSTKKTRGGRRPHG